MSNKYSIKMDRTSIVIIDNSTGRVFAHATVESKLKTEICSPKFVDWLINTNPETSFYIPVPLLSKEQRNKCYNDFSISLKKDFIRDGYMKGLITPDMLKELLDNNDFNALYWDIPVFEKINKDAYNQENAEKLLSKNNGIYIRFIPEEYLTFEMCKKAVELDRHNISGVPMKYQSIELQKLALDQSYRSISSIPEEALSDEIIRYALNLNGHALSGIPKEKKTAEYCEIAFSKNPKSFTFIPDKYKNHEMCVQAVLNDPLAIKNVPVRIINEQFLQEIHSSYVVIPEKLMGYVKQCIDANKRASTILDKPVNLDEVSNKQLSQNSKNLSEISIDSLSDYFSSYAYDYLKKNNIETLEQLCNFVNQPESLIVIKNFRIRNEITGTTLLLKCKYMNEDPLIDIKDDKYLLKDIIHTIGLSTKAITCLHRAGYANETINDFFNLVRTSKIDYKLRFTGYVGEKTFKEIIFKLRIITKYYDNVESKSDNTVQANNENIDTSESLEKLNVELQRLREERAKIDAQTDIVLAKIQEKMKVQSKGGVQR